MKKLSFKFTIFTMVFGLHLSCEDSKLTDNENQVESKQLEIADEEFSEADFYDQFTYIKKFDVSSNFDHLYNLLPVNKKDLSQGDANMRYQWNNGSFSHDVSAFSYGYDDYAEVHVTLNFSEESKTDERVMIYLNKVIQEKNGYEYSNYRKTEVNELAEWYEERMEGTYVISLSHDFTKREIIYAHYIKDMEDLGFENGTEGEWVTGPNGELTWKSYF